jgi:hypothetical protein
MYVGGETLANASLASSLKTALSEACISKNVVLRRGPAVRLQGPAQDGCCGWFVMARLKPCPSAEVSSQEATRLRVAASERTHGEGGFGTGEAWPYVKGRFARGGGSRGIAGFRGGKC